MAASPDDHVSRLLITMRRWLQVRPPWATGVWSVVMVEAVRGWHQVVPPPSPDYSILYTGHCTLRCNNHHQSTGLIEVASNSLQIVKRYCKMIAQCAAVQCTLSQWSLIDNSSHTIKNRPSVKSHRKQSHSHTPLSNQQLGYPGKNSNCTCLSFFLGFYYIHIHIM